MASEIGLDSIVSEGPTILLKPPNRDRVLKTWKMMKMPSRLLRKSLARDLNGCEVPHES